MGLLFVAVSLAPRLTFGKEAEGWRRSEALSAFTALANSFFLSLLALIPGINLGIAAAVMSVVGLIQTLDLLTYRRQWRLDQSLGRGVLVMAASLFVYGSELSSGRILLGSPHQKQAET